MRKVDVKFATDNGVVQSFTVESNNIPMGVAKARLELLKWCRKNNVSVDGFKMKSAAFVHTPNSEPTIDDIHHRIMSGRHVSGRDIGRWVRSPRGMMAISMMRGGV